MTGDLATLKNTLQRSRVPFGVLVATIVVGFAPPTAAQVAQLDNWTLASSSAPASTNINVNPAGPNFTAAAGARRLLVVAAVLELNTANGTIANFNATLGGTALTAVATTETLAGREHAKLWYLLDAQIPAAASALVVTGTASQTVAGLHIYRASFSGVDQGGPINGSAANASAAATVSFGAQVDFMASGWTFYAAGNGGAPATQAPPAGFVNQRLITTTFNHTSAIEDTGLHGASGNFPAGSTITFGGTTSTRSAVAVASLRPFLADVSIAKTAPAAPVYLGDTFAYTLTVTNNGPSTATNVTVTDTLPAGLQFVSATPSQGTCGTPTVTCTLGTINSGATATVSISVMARSLGAKSNTAAVTATEPDPNAANNSSTVALTVLQINIANVAITKAGAPASQAVGGNVTYTLVVTNGGPDTANAVTVSDPLPAGMTWVSTTTTLGTCTGTAIVTCNLGNMANGASATITIVATVAAGGTKNNTATVAIDTTSTYDPNATNNSASVLTTVTGAAVLVCNVPALAPAALALSGVVNSYYPGTASVAAGATSITLGAARAAPGAQVPIASGDLVLVIQMQDATIDSSNSANYGGNNGTGAGALVVNAGRYEFVRATNGVTLLGGALNVQGAGAGTGLVNAYNNANATAAKGQVRFQVVRVPQYTTATLAGVTAAPWLTDRSGGATNGLGTGGVVAVDIQGSLTLSSGVAASVDGQGFRGAAGRRLLNQTSPCGGMALTNTDWRTSSTCNTNGGKGEGNAGTPMWIYDPAGTHACGGAIGAPTDYFVNTNQPNDGYPNGSMARGAPGSAGGGSTDDQPTVNDRNSGGGGGSNGGAGGTGGHSWSTNLDRGGRGAAVTPAITQLVLGGGGGAGTRNNGDCPGGATAAIEGQSSSGAAGGGLLVVQAASFTAGAGASVTANGANAYDDTLNDGGGGGGAGGSVILVVTSGTMSGLAAQAVGGNGGSAWKLVDGATFPGNRHGPGGGGGGGVIVYTNTAVPPTFLVTGGASGTTTLANDTFSALPGGNGQTLLAGPSQIPGVGSAAACSSDPAISISHFPATTLTGTNVAFVTRVTNAAPFVSTSGTVSVTITLDPGLAFSGLASGTGWTCAVPAGQSVTCTRNDALAAQQTYPTINFNATVIAAGPTTLSNNTATVTNLNDMNAANNTASDVVGVTAPTLARLRSFEAIRADRAVELRWQTSFESRNLGFRVHREEGGARRLLTPSLIAGSALFVGRQPMSSGRSYAWVDRAPTANAVYWLEDVDVSGARHWTGPATVQDPGPGAGWVSARAESPLLKTLGRPDAARPPRPPAPGLGTARWAPRVPPRKTPADPWRLPSGPAAKLLVREEGWYRVSKAELLAAGFDPGVDPTRLRLVAAGVEQAIQVKDGGDGSFDASDTIEFYGLGFFSPYDASHAYWLTVGSGPGARIGSGIPGGAAPGPTSFPFTIERRDRTVFFAALTNNGEAENFFGAVVTPDPVSLELTVDHLDGESPADATLTVALQGVTLDSVHDVQVQLNGQPLGEVSFSAQQHAVQQFDVPAGLLSEGVNLVVLSALAGDGDISVVDSIQLSYSHLYALDAGALRMTAPGATRIGIGGLADESMRVMDVTDAAHPQELSVEFVPNGPGFDSSFQVPGFASAALFAFTPDRVLQPAAIVPNTPSDLRSRRNRADLVVIAHPTLLDSLEPLKAMRSAQGLATTLVDVTDVYDEFGWGQKTPFAIRDFLSRARLTWKRRPRYVLMAGDASFDPKNYLGMGDFDLVPTKLVPTAYLKTDSDDWFVDFDQNGLPEMAIGRLPARTPQEASLIVAKIQAHEAATLPGNEDWSQRVLLVADRPGEFDFDAASAQVQALVPPGLVVEQIAVSQLEGATHDALVQSMDTGQLLVNYIGHGSETVWSQEGIFSGLDARALTNETRLPVVVAMTCLNGLFDDLYVESLAESLLKAPSGGAVAVWTSSALTEPTPQSEMNLELVRLLFQSPGMTLGEAVARAKAAVTDQDVRRSWILFGDPAMHLRPSSKQH